MAIYNILWETPCKVSNQMKQVFMKKSLIWWTNWFNGFLLIYWRLNSFSIFVCYLLNPDTGIYIVHFDQYPPPPSFWDSFFPRRISLRRRDEAPPDATTAGGLEGGRKTPPRNFTVYNPKRCIFKAFSPVFYVIFLPFGFPFFIFFP